MGHPCPASDECAIRYNTRHTCPGSGAGAPPQTRSGGRDIPGGSYRSASRRTGSATAIGGAVGLSRMPMARKRCTKSGPYAEQKAIGIAELWSLRYLPAKHVELLAKDEDFCDELRSRLKKRGHEVENQSE